MTSPGAPIKGRCGTCNAVTAELPCPFCRPDDEIRDRLAVALRQSCYWSSQWMPERDGAEGLADALLPIVRAIAADELEAEAAYDDQAPDEQYARGLFARRLRVRAENLRAATLAQPAPGETL